jgi:hypothetical protein
MSLRRATLCFAVISSSSSPGPGRAAWAESPEHALAKQTQNPLATLLTIPFEMSFLSGGVLEDRSLLGIEVEPIIPINLTPTANAIVRVTVPMFDVPRRGGGHDFGVGDTELEVLLTPSRACSVCWGLGPVVSAPTATLEAATTGSWAFGAAGAGVVMTNRWVFGAVVKQLWTVADYGNRRSVDRLQLQPFVDLYLGAGWTLETAPTITADRVGDTEWIVPIGGGLIWTGGIDRQPINVSVHYYARLRDGDDESLLLVGLSLLYPKSSAARRHHATAALE